MDFNNNKVDFNDAFHRNMKIIDKENNEYQKIKLSKIFVYFIKKTRLLKYKHVYKIKLINVTQ